jgi:hypothetical protein
MGLRFGQILRWGLGVGWALGWSWSKDCVERMARASGRRKPWRISSDRHYPSLSSLASHSLASS